MVLIYMLSLVHQNKTIKDWLNDQSTLFDKEQNRQRENLKEGAADSIHEDILMNLSINQNYHQKK